HPGRLPLYHFDLYRLDRASELEDIGFYDMLDADGVAMIEWGDRFPEALPDDHLLVLISREGDDRRRFEVRASGPRSGDLAAAWLTALRAEEQTR
ncbi:MAG: tRNA (adenosine(37)-N6)-threonylcarbamoyltransferase complex ATPase subunit type 1 TsaE, partial [Coriobacteriia bacterium]|nr:tRNA (adenosine(37)-N6)-threonylcarbamoyltransferase complex ATPase subunit type 1 TsaE [Coriobacteriia bacterium]